MKFTAAEQKTLHLALSLAAEWESSLAASYTPDFGEPPADSRREIAKAKKNIDKFARLRERLRAAERTTS